MLNRRILLKGLAAAPSLAALRWAIPAQAAEGLALHALTERVSLLTGAGGNVVVFKGNQGLALVDSGAAAHTAELLAQVDQLGVPIHTLINTHWHDEHSGGNEAIHGRGAKILAHENTRLWLGADFDVSWRNRTHRPRPPAAFPDETVYVSGVMDIGGEAAEYLHYPQAHTDGDLALHFMESKVLVCGGLLSNYRYPICDIASGGWIGGLVAANAALLQKIDEATIVVPDRGPALKKADLQAQHDMLVDLYEKMKAAAQNGLDAQDMLDAKLTADYDATWGDPAEFVDETYRGMWAHTYDMGGFI